MTGRRGRRRRKLLDDLKERRGYCHLKEEALDRTMWRAGFGRGFGPVVRQTTKIMMITGENGRHPDHKKSAAFVEWFIFKVRNKKYINSQFYASVKAKINFV